jgi:8-oxo-dGTP pyrophosphatase MutT (NUDIX family)
MESSELLRVYDSDGRFLDRLESREICHQFGFWHCAAAVFVYCVDHNNKTFVLVQRRSQSKRQWPGMADIVSAGGQVVGCSTPLQTAIDELRTELGISLKESDLLQIGFRKSTDTEGGMDNRHFNYYYAAKLNDIDLDQFALQEGEVESVAWKSKDEIVAMRARGELAEKPEAWSILMAYLDSLDCHQRPLT